MSFTIRLETDADDFFIEEIIKKAFGPGRFAKTAYRLRESKIFSPLFGLVTENHLGHIVATIRLSYLTLPQEKIIFLGPIAVHHDLRSMGLGLSLIKIAQYYCYNYPINTIMLIGDPQYYQRFGFKTLTSPDAHIYAMFKHYPINQKRILIWRSPWGQSTHGF